MNNSSTFYKIVLAVCICGLMSTVLPAYVKFAWLETRINQSEELITREMTEVKNAIVSSKTPWTIVTVTYTSKINWQTANRVIVFYTDNETHGERKTTYENANIVYSSDPDIGTGTHSIEVGSGYIETEEKMISDITEVHTEKDLLNK